MSSNFVKIPVSDGGSSISDGKYVRTTRFQSIASGTSGTLTLPTTATIVLNDFGGTVDAVISSESGGKPSLQEALDTIGNPIDVTLDSLGNWVLSGTPLAYPVDIIYRVRQLMSDFDSLSNNIMGPVGLDSGGEGSASDASLVVTDITTNNSSTTKHGFLKKLSNVATEYMNGQGNWVTITGAQYINNLTSDAQTQISARERNNDDMYKKYFMDFYTNTELPFLAALNGTGANTAQITGTNATENTTGVVRFAVSAVNDRAGGRLGNAGGMWPFYLGNGGSFETNNSSRFAFGALPDATDTTKTHFGWVDDTLAGTNSEPTNFIGFRYDPTVNSGKFQAVNRTSGADTFAIDTGHTPVANVNDVYSIRMDQLGSAFFYINSTLVATSTGTLCAPTALIGAHFKLIKTAGTGSKNIAVDWWSLEYFRSTPR